MCSAGLNKKITGAIDFMSVTARNTQLIKSQVKKGDVLFTPSSETKKDIGISAVVYEDLPKTLFSYHLLRLSFTKDLNLNFKCYLFNSETVLKQFELLSQGLTRYTIGLGNFNEIFIPIPSLPEQQKIADILSTVDEQISTTDKIIEKSKELKKGLIQKLFSEGIEHTEFKDTKIGRIPKDWKVETLEFFGDGKQGLRRGPFGGALKKEIFVSDGYLVYEQQNAIYKDFNRGRYYVNEEKYNEMSAFQVKSNDLIVSCSGTIGRIAIVPKNSKPGIINQALLRIRLKNIIDRKFFYYLWFSKPVQNKVLDMTQGSTMKNIVGMSTLRKTKLILPPLPEQTKNSSHTFRSRC